jgi:hypothetical protein
MALTLDPSGDWACWDGLEPVTYRSVARTGDVDAEVASALRKKLGYKELAFSGGVYTSQDRKWLVPQSLLSAALDTPPKPADLVIDQDAVPWTVLEVDRDELQKVWELTTRNIVLAFDLRDTVSIERPTFAQDAAAGRTFTTYTTAYAGVAARVQEQTADSAEERGKRVKVRQFAVYVGRRLYLQEGDRLKDASNNVYEVKGWQDADRIDQLMQVNCERRW